MVITDRVRQLALGLARISSTLQRIHRTAPDIVPNELIPFTLVSVGELPGPLMDMVEKLPEDKHDVFCSTMEQAIKMFDEMAADMDKRIKERQQPEDVPRREGARVIRQFKRRKGEW